MENRKLVVGNMKLHLSKEEVIKYVEDMKDYKDCVICPTYIYLPYFIEKGFTVGSQDISQFDLGAFTGEVAASQIKSIGAEYTIIGHSERREYFKEDNELINDKVKTAIDNGLKVILCVGETEDERDNGLTNEKIKKQLLNNLKGIEHRYYENIIIAYEPIWAIGTGNVPSNNDIQKVVSFIKEVVHDNFEYMPLVLYGGSTNDKNIEELSSIHIVDGFLVGGACLKPEQFKKIIETTR
jgi:triosephosphate isomerase